MRAKSLQSKDAASLSRSERRVDAILRAATQMFLEFGYANTSVDDIVKRAGGSKATIYKHFKSKRELFSAVIDAVVVRRSQEEIDFDEPEPDKALREFATKRFKVVLSADNVALMRMVIAAAPNFPKIARAYYEHGPAHSHEILVEYLRVQGGRGKLRITDPDEAAFHFTSLLMHPWYVKRLQWVDATPTKADVERSVSSAVSAFMKLYGR